VTQTAQQPVVVTTLHKGVFFGFLNGDHARDAKTIELADAQMCVYWSSDVQGVIGLAATGPTSRCKVTRPVPRMTLQDITAVIDATGEAVKLWQDRPWS
jgi:hypothetical protein